MRKLKKRPARTEKPRGDWVVGARFAGVFATLQLSRAPYKTAMLRRLCTVWQRYSLGTAGRLRLTQVSLSALVHLRLNHRKEVSNP